MTNREQQEQLQQPTDEWAALRMHRQHALRQLVENEGLHNSFMTSSPDDLLTIGQ
jgi:hypothetical protein